MIKVICCLILLTFCSCLNSYEQEAIGKYELNKYSLVNTNIKIDDFSTLLLKENRTFELKYFDKILTGDWKADDFGDWTQIDLNLYGKVIEGRILENSILFEGSEKFEFANFKSMEFTKIKK